MQPRRARIVLALVALAFLAGVVADAAPASASLPGQNTASETYYTLDVEGGKLSVRLEATIQPQGADIEEAWFYAMPGATNVEVRKGGELLESKVENLIDFEGLPLLITAKLPAKLKGKLKADLVVTYTVPSIQPGAIESYFVSQGTGSFVFIDLPVAAENVLDPGCLKVAKQPEHVSEIGLQRWVCGDAGLIALNTEDPKTQEQCAKLNDRCRQRIFDDPFSAYAQSITDPRLRGVLQEQITLGEKDLTISLRYFATDQEWADKQWGIAKSALPKLEALFGFPYPNDQILLRESRQIEWFGALGVAFPAQGEMLLSAGSALDDEVTVHELAHQWAGRNLESPWLWEGLAEWATGIIAPELGLTKYDRQWSEYGYTDPLSTWYHGSAIFNPDYWYGKSAAFWAAYEAAVGGRANVTAILGQLDDDPAALPAGPRWFMDVGEEVSGANLDELFLEWVWFEEYAGRELAQRRAAHQQIEALKESAAALGLSGVPTDIQANLATWSFGKVEAQIKEADAVLTAYQALLALLASSGLPSSSVVAESWPAATTAATKALVVDLRLAVEAMMRAEGTLAGEPAGSVPLRLLEEARVAFALGDVNGAAELAAKAESIVFNAAASVRMVAIAEATQEDFSGNFFRTIGLVFEDPDGDLEAAQAALEAGETDAALEYSRSAYDAWNGAQKRGLQRLAILAAVMCGLTFGAWWLLRRIDGRNDPGTRVRGLGHYLEGPSERARSWKDWENSP
jgi:hypothetical protein